ncbi:MAG: hypothetical protein F7B17_00735 [Desulfurococcales archaeon]|nr:hypothetical protein [Desulfurococcales archaeon]
MAQPYRVKGGLRLPTLPNLAPLPALERFECIAAEAPIAQDTGVYINPSKALDVRLEDLPEAVREILSANPSWAGLTGSWAVFEETGSSDVDLLLYYDDLPSGIRALSKTLGKMGLRGCKGPRSAWPARAGVEARIVEVCRGSLRVTLRILKRIWGETCSTPKLAPAGKLSGVIEILGEESPCSSITVPARYLFRGPRGLQGVLETWRTSFQELPRGLYRIDALLRIERDSGLLVATPDYGGGLRLVRTLGGLSSRECRGS